MCTSRAKLSVQTNSLRSPYENYAYKPESEPHKYGQLLLWILFTETFPHTSPLLVCPDEEEAIPESARGHDNL
jgi:hypothetical protein